MGTEEVLVCDGGPASGSARLYREQGYLVAPALLSPAEVAELKQETALIFRGGRGPVDGLLQAVTGLTDAQVLEKYLAIHFPHKISPVVRRYLSHPRVVEVLTQLVGPNVKCMQSMLFVKGPGKAGQAWHQDEYYIPTRDRSLIGAWIAIDAATLQNGCLSVIPGSHRAGVIHRRIAGVSAEFAESDTVDVTEYSNEQQVPIEVESGSVVFFNGYLLHSSRRNRTSDCFRMALVNHYMSAESLLPWDLDHTLAPTEDLRDITLVAGVDPYAWKGLVDVSKPFLRAETRKPG